MAPKPPLAPWVVALACCYHAATEAPCTVSCATDGTCPAGLACGADQLCHGGNQDCSELVTGSFGHLLITNDSTGVPAETDVVYNPDQLDVAAVLSDTGAVPTISYDDDSFSFSRNAPDEAYRLSVRAQQEMGFSTETQGVEPSVEQWTPYFGRIARAGVNKSTPITFDLTGTPAARSFVSSTGLRTFTAGPAPVAGSGSGSFIATFDWDTATSLFGALGTLQSSQGDELWYTGYAMTGSASAPDAYWSVSSALEDKVDLTNAKPTSVAGTLATVAADRCVTLTLPRATEDARVIAANGFGSGSGITTSSAWDIQTTPRSDLSPLAGIDIVFPVAQLVSDQTIQFVYADPYPETEVAIMSAQFRRSLVVGTSKLTIAYGTTQYAQVPNATPQACASVALDATIAMPAVPTFGGTTLDTDGQTVMLDRSGLVELDFAPTTAGSVDDWLVELFEATPAGASVALTELRAYSTLVPSVQIDPTLLQAGQAYVFEIFARLGYPDAAKRDYRAIAYPFGTGVAYSSAFIAGP